MTRSIDSSQIQGQPLQPAPDPESGQPGDQAVTKATVPPPAQQDQPPQPAPDPASRIDACDDNRSKDRSLRETIVSLAFGVWLVLLVLSFLAALTGLFASSGPYVSVIGSSDTGYLVGIGICGSIVVAGYVVVVFSPLALWLRLLLSVAVVTVFVGAFSSFYYVWGNTVSPRYSERALQNQKLPPIAYDGFGQRISKVDAIYFTVGTLTTAGTGSLSAKSQNVRITAIIQMTLGVGLLTVGIAGFMKDRQSRSNAHR